MDTWYIDNTLDIEFSALPDVKVRYPKNYLPRTQNEEITKKPFICMNEVKVCITDYREYREYIFRIPEFYTWDGASIPRAFWRIIGAKTDPKFLIPSMIHDYLCENHAVIGNDRYLADRVFEKLLKVSGVGSFKRWMMFHSVDNFQKFCGWND